MKNTTIRIEIEGGNITSIQGIPKGYKIKIVDHDLEAVGEKSTRTYCEDSQSQSWGLEL